MIFGGESSGPVNFLMGADSERVDAEVAVSEG
jgi:hypothetical protein